MTHLHRAPSVNELLQERSNGHNIETGELPDVSRRDDVLFFEQQFDQFVNIVVLGWLVESTSATNRGVSWFLTRSNPGLCFHGRNWNLSPAIFRLSRNSKRERLGLSPKLARDRQIDNRLGQALIEGDVPVGVVFLREGLSKPIALSSSNLARQSSGAFP
jgi:hypothetical protein